ncbi:MAG TPA: glycosyltransferase [Ideonella sp.]|uniref:glycosyltransferase n=1 Tax=Ideonella sp. TaxID=1929293 RepID=UPI002B771D31|nr:glycosyltransferase [Ideonella sp.]HSI46726.1 glycosyltransferase [Ideonella sp.]
MRPRVLLVCFNRLAPADQGNSRRILQLLRIYRSLGHEVDLLYHADEGHDVGLSQAMRAQFGLVRVVPARASKRIGADHACRLSDWYDRGLEAPALEMHRLRVYQVVHVNYVWYAPLLQCFGAGVAKVLDSHDLFADRAARHVEAGLPPAWFSTTRAEEDRAFEMADVVLAIQHEEAREMAARGHRHILYLPWVEVPVRDFVPRPDGPSNGAGGVLTLGYLGSGNMWNVRSLQALAEALMQRPLRGRPAFQLIVAGSLAWHAAKLGNTPGLVPYGFVKELSGFYASVDVALNPMVGGTGLKIKTVEPLAYGCPVLATQSGIHGLSQVWQLPVFESPAELAEFLVTELAPHAAEGLAQLREQALRTRVAWQAECDRQAGHFTRWLVQRLASHAVRPPAVA